MEPRGNGRYPMLTGESNLMMQVFDLIGKVASSDTTVIIYGESGTGKERVAKTIHQCGDRAPKPFVPVNCAAIPENLLESELFGHEKGAFTGAIAMRAGRFELASGGTIFLDEIGELHPSLQVKLLRVLQERQFERVGGTKTISVDVRILAATNRDLEAATRTGTFREDLYYRLNVIPMHLPPLRLRRNDIPLLIKEFISGFSRKRGREVEVAPEVIEKLQVYHWPGNVRELENMVERMVTLCDNDAITMQDVPPRITGAAEPSVISTAPMSPAADEGPRFSYTEPKPDYLFPLPEGGVDLNLLMDEIERHMITVALKRVGGVKSKAATLLGLNRTTLIEKIKKKNITF